MELGIDVGTLLEERDAKAKYFKDGQLIDPLKEFRDNNVTLIRLRIWNDPYSKDGKPYLGGTCSIDNVIKIINLTKGYGYKYILDFHYSDFWVDPGKQILPKAWKELGYHELKDEAGNFTRDTLLRIKKETNADIPYIQVGNEITNGFLWPFGALIDQGKNKVRANYAKFASLLTHFIKMCNEVYPLAKTIIHLERSNDNYVYNELFTELTTRNVPFDIIGMSYYPYWHGSLDEVFYNIDYCHKKFKKDVMIMELGYGFTLEDYIFTNNGVNQMKINPDNLKEINIPFEISPLGQAKFIETFLNECKKRDYLKGIVYWEPLWIPGDNICWASKEGQAYIHEEGKSTRNEWSNQCLFDYSGNMLPGFNKFKL